MNRLLRRGCLISVVGWSLLLASERNRPSAQEPSGKKIALLVGVNQYDKRNFRDLEYAERDVTELAPLLEKSGYEIHLLTGSASGTKRATLKNIQAAIETVLKDRTKRDLIVVALAGHGLQIEIAPDGKELQAESFYCPADAESGNHKTMLPMGHLFDEIKRRGGGQNLVLVDACREDPTRGRGMDGSTVKTLPEGVAVLFGCRAGQKTFETKKAGGGHGVFFHFVLEGLRGSAINEDGEVTWGRLVEYVAKRVKNETPAMLGDESIKQTPNLIANLGGDSPVLLIPPKSQRPPALLVAPFDERAAKARQTDWVRHLGKSSAVDENTLKMKLVLIPPGEFMMGTAEAEIDRAVADFPGTKREWLDDAKRHRVRIAQPFYLAAHEVTKRQFREFVTAKDYKTEAETDGKGGAGADLDNDKAETGPKYSWRNTGFTQGDDHPVVNVTWNDAVEFCKWLSEKERKEYRLPTEAEWEYACRAGTTTAYVGGDDPETLATYGNVSDGTLKAKHPDTASAISARDGYVFTAPVGEFRANAFGLYDMHGNVWEWCRDWYRKDYEQLGADDPVNLTAGSERVVRGGSWASYPVNCRSSLRYTNEPTVRSYYLGFRVVRAR